MPVSKYCNKDYRRTITSGIDTLTLSKSPTSDRSIIIKESNGAYSSEITLSSREAAEQLRFMLGQLLDERGE